jgi:hypothetical protein
MGNNFTFSQGDACAMVATAAERPDAVTVMLSDSSSSIAVADTEQS